LLIAKAENTCKERYVRADVIGALAWEFALQSKKSAVEFLAMLKEYQAQQQVQLGPLAEQITEIKSLIEIASRKIKRIAKMRGDATDDDEAEQYTADLEAAKADKTSMERKLKKLESEHDWTEAITDNDIIAVLETREKDLAKLRDATFDEKRRYLAKIDVRVTVKERKATIKCRLPISPKTLDLDSVVVADALKVN
jgi:predicted  nucleic acid-binding Zn-ribbon protein